MQIPRSSTASNSFTLTSSLGKRMIVLLAVTQALLLLLFHEGVIREWALFEGITFRTIYLTLVLAVPAALHLLLNDPRSFRPWTYALGMGVMLLPLAWYVGSQAAPELGVESRPLLVPFGASIFVGWFVSLAFLQAGRIGRWFDYDALFEASWHHALSLALAALFTGCSWLLLLLCMELFDVIGITVVEEIFTDRRFAYAATGLIVGLGVVLVRSYAGATEAVRGVLLALVKALLPLGTVITLVFLAALPITGLQPLWDTGHAAALMMALTALMILLLNGVFGDGRNEPPYPAVVRRVVEVAFVVLPAYPILSGYALFLRVDQYGWTLMRFWAALVILAVGVYAFAYAVSVFRSSGRWMQGMRTANTRIALGLVAAAILVNSPLIDATRIAAADQTERLRNTSQPPAELEDDLQYLRFRAGKRGYRALRRLQEEAAFDDRPRLAGRLDMVLARERPSPERPEVVPPDDLRGKLTVAPDTASPVPEEVYHALGSAPFARTCVGSAECVLLRVDLRTGSPEEYVLFVKIDGRLQSQVVAAGADSIWQPSGALEMLEGVRADSVWQAVQAGDIETAPSPWRDLIIGGTRLGRR